MLINNAYYNKILGIKFRTISAEVNWRAAGMSFCPEPSSSKDRCICPEPGRKSPRSNDDNSTHRYSPAGLSGKEGGV